MAAQPVFLVYKCLYSPHELKQKHTDCGQTVPTTNQSVVDFIFSVSEEVRFPVGLGPLILNVVAVGPLLTCPSLL